MLSSFHDALSKLSVSKTSSPQKLFNAKYGRSTVQHGSRENCMLQSVKYRPRVY